MIDSGAATHVCPPWFAPNSPMYTLQHGQGPQLRTATDENIQVYGCKWILMTNVNKQQLVVPFFNGNTENIEDAYQTLDTKQQKRILRGEPWTGETWFRVKRGTPLPGNTPPMPSLPATRTTVPTSANPVPAQATEHPTGRMRHTTKQPPFDPARATGSTSIPHPMSEPPTADYRIREGHLWKRVHVKPRHDLDIPQQADDGPDVTRRHQPEKEQQW